MDVILYSLGVSLIIFSIFLFFYLYKRSLVSQYKKIKNDYGNLDIEELRISLDFVKDGTIDEDTLDETHDIYTQLNQETIPLIVEDMDSLQARFKKKFTIDVFSLRNSMYLLLEHFYDYRNQFYNITFRLNEVKIMIELLQESLDFAKDNFHILKNLVKTNQFSSQIQNSEFTKDFNEIVELIELVEEKMKIDSNESQRNRILKLIRILKKSMSDYNEIIFKIDNVKKAEGNVQSIVSKIKHTPKILETMFIKVNKTSIALTKSQREIEQLLFRRKLEKAAELYKEFSQMVTNFKIDYSTQIDSYKILKKVIPFITEISSKFETVTLELVDEMKKRNYQNKSERIKKINKKVQPISDSIKKFNLMKKEGFSKHSPEEFINVCINIKDSYNDFIKDFDSNLKEVKEALKDINQINELIARANAFLLEIDYKLKQLNKKIQQKYENIISQYQNFVNAFISKYKQFVEPNVSVEEFNQVNKLVNKITNMNIEINQLYFTNLYIEQLIITLNKYRDENYDLPEIIDDIQNAYNSGDISFVLRHSLKIIQMHKLYE